MQVAKYLLTLMGRNSTRKNMLGVYWKKEVRQRKVHFTALPTLMTMDTV